MTLLIGLGFAALSVAPAMAQARRVLLCREQAAAGLKPGEPPEAFRLAPVPKGSFSLVLNRELLSLITAGRTDYFECQRVTARAEGRRQGSTLKCQNGTHFVTLDLSRWTFLKAQLNPEDEGEVSVSYGVCGPV
ncbi:hypothetical protein [Methylobacterium sp. A54F]